MRITSLSLLLLHFTINSANGFVIEAKWACSQRTSTSLSSSFTNDIKTTDGTSTDETTATSRRTFLLSSSIIAGATAITISTRSPPPPATLLSTDPSTVKTLTSTSEALALLEESCNRRFLHAIVASDYHFLYRGLPSPSPTTKNIPSTTTTTPLVRSEPYDLLSDDTYGSPAASSFFNTLDSTMSTDAVRPSNGHLAVTSPARAGEWGTPVSVWPLGDDDVHFAWFRSGGAFYPRDGAVVGGSVKRNEIVVDGVNCGDVSLEDALRGDGTEVMFSAERFLAVPIGLEGELREGLKKLFII